MCRKLKRSTCNIFASALAVLMLGVGTWRTASADPPVCYYPGSLLPVSTTLLCDEQCEYGLLCKHLDGGTTYAYTECSSTSGSGTEQQCHLVSVVVSEIAQCQKDSTKPCNTIPYWGGCINGACAPDSDAFQCKIKTGTAPSQTMQDKLLPYETFTPCD